MRPRVLLSAALVVAAVACSSPSPDPYAAYRQTTTEDVPGTLDWQIGPVPDDYRPTIGPAQAYDELFDAGDAEARLRDPGGRSPTRPTTPSGRRRGSS